jgi:hypothetical protein
MHADLDLLCISVYCTADDLLPERPSNARRRLSDAEIVTLCVAQVLMGIPSDRRFLRAARRQLGHVFPLLPSQDALHKRRSRLAESIEWLIVRNLASCPPPMPAKGLPSDPRICGAAAIRSSAWIQRHRSHHTPTDNPVVASPPACSSTTAVGGSRLLTRWDSTATR